MFVLVETLFGKVDTSEKLTASIFFSQQPAWVPNKDQLMGGLTGTLQGVKNYRVHLSETSYFLCGTSVSPLNK